MTTFLISFPFLAVHLLGLLDIFLLFLLLFFLFLLLSHCPRCECFLPRYRFFSMLLPRRARC